MLFGLAHLAAPGDAFELSAWRLELVDMDRTRVDRVLATPPEEGARPDGDRSHSGGQNG